jgi:hypothetical protein
MIFVEPQRQKIKIPRIQIAKVKKNLADRVSLLVMTAQEPHERFAFAAYQVAISGLGTALGYVKGQSAALGGRLRYRVLQECCFLQEPFKFLLIPTCNQTALRLIASWYGGEQSPLASF